MLSYWTDSKTSMGGRQATSDGSKSIRVLETLLLRVFLYSKHHTFLLGGSESICDSRPDQATGGKRLVKSKLEFGINQVVLISRKGLCFCRSKI